MSVEEVEKGVTQLSVEELARFSRWFEEYTRAAELDRRRQAVMEVRQFREEMARKYGVQPDSTEIIREMRDNPRA